MTHARARVFVFAIALAALLAFAREVRADAVPAAKGSCPEGSIAVSTHSGESCQPVNCNEDKDCSPGRICRDRPLCIETKTRPAGGQLTRGMPDVETYATAVGSCESGGKCAYPAQCSEASKRCVRAGLAERYRTSCGCRLPGAPADDAWVAVFAGALVASLYARRRARAAREI